MTSFPRHLVTLFVPRCMDRVPIYRFMVGWLRGRGLEQLPSPSVAAKCGPCAQGELGALACWDVMPAGPASRGSTQSLIDFKSNFV